MVKSKEKSEAEVLAIVGARSGSKGVPHKNIRPLGGKPLLGWIIEAARSSKKVTRVIVSRDSSEYAEAARNYGAETPFLRPTEISGDASPDLDYLLHAIDWLEAEEGYKPDAVVRLIPTVPFQRPEDINECVNKLFSDVRFDSVLGVAEARQHPGKALRTTEEGFVVPYFGEFTLNTYPNARQAFPKAYFRGNIIATRYEALKNKRSLYGERSGYHITPRQYAMDIDSELDFIFAEALLDKIKTSHDFI